MAGRIGHAGRYPGIVLGGGEFVEGELFAVFAEGVWKALDLYEGAEYRLVPAEAVMECGERVGCWVYEWVG